MNLEEVARLRLEILGDEAEQTVQNLEKGLKDINSELRLMELNGEKGSEAWKELKKAQSDVKDELKEIKNAIDINDASWRELSALSKQLNRDLQNLKIGSEEWIEQLKKIAEVEDRMSDVRQEMGKIKGEGEEQMGFWTSFKANFTAAFAWDIIKEAGMAIFEFGKQAIQTAAEYSDSFADIRKTTSMSVEEVRELNAQLQGINTRTSQLDLLNIAKVGGAIGIAKEEMYGFVEAVDKAVVALGDEFSGGAEQVAKEMGILKNLFAETKDLEAGDAINKIGSAINELGAAGSATGPVIADFTQRMGQLGNLSPQIAQTMGLGAAFEELGLSAEIAAGGLSNILLGAAKGAEAFAEHLNMTEDAFKALINTNPNEVILQLAASFRGLPTDVVVKQLDDLGIKSQEATKVMMLLSDQTEIVRDKQELASKAMEAATSLTDEFNIKNQTLAAELEKAGKEVEVLKLSIGDKLIPVVTTAVTGFVAFLKVLGAIPEFVSENKAMFIALGVALVSLNAANIAAAASTLAHAAAEKGRLIWTEAATVAQWAMNAALTANPIGLIVAAVALLVGGFITLYNNSETLRKIIDGVWAALKTGIDVAKDVVAAVERGFDQMLTKMPFLTRAFEAIWDGADTVFTAIGDAMDWVSDKVGEVSNFFGGLARKVSETGSAIGTAMNPAFEYITGGFNFVKKGINDFFEYIQKRVGEVTGFLRAITPDGFKEAVNVFFDAGKRISKSFNDSFLTEQEDGHKNQTAANKKNLDKKVVDGKGAATVIATNDTDANAKALEEKAKANKKAFDERVKANEDALKAIGKVEIAAIKDDLERAIANENAKYAEEKKRIEKSKADADLKAKWLEALEKENTAKIEKINADYNAKKEKADRDTAQKIDSFKAKFESDDLSRKIAAIEAAARKDLAEAQSLVKDKEELARIEAAIDAKKVADITAVRDKDRKDTEAKEKTARDLKLKSEKDLFDAEFKAFQAKTEAELASTKEGSNAQLQFKLNNLAQEYDYRKQKLMREAADEKARLAESIQDSDQRAAALKNIDDRLTSQLKTNDAQLQADKTRLLAEQHENRLNNTKGFFDAVEGLAKGDFASFTNYLLSKVKNDQSANDSRLKSFSENGVKTLEIAGQVVEGMQQLNQAYLESKLKKIEKEKQSQLDSWEEEYRAGRISKIDYQRNIDRINAEAADKEKNEKLKAWKRDQAMQIGMALINAAMAALKSLATMGFPLGLIGVAASAGLAAIQIGIIKRQAPPSFAGGGTLPAQNYVRNAGVPQGPGHGSSYGKSGIALTRRDTGQEVGEMEGDEPIMILSRQTYKNNRRTIDRLLDSSLHKNGAPIHARDGAVFWGSDSPVEPLRYGDSYLFGSKKRKAAYNAQMQAQYDADMQAKQQQEDMSSMDYSSYDSGDSYGDYGGDSGGGYEGEDYAGGTYGGGGDADATVGATNAQIGKSQQMMEAIAKNTAATVTAVQALKTTVDQGNNLLNQSIGLLNDIRNKPTGPSLHDIQGAVAAATASNAKSDL